MLRFRHRNPEDDYAKDLATWQIRHNADRHDLTPEQDERRIACNPLLDAGLDPTRLAAVSWAVKRGRVHEWPSKDDR